MSKTKLVPFDIELAKAGAKVVTRCGYPVRISDFELKNKDGYRLIGVIDVNGNEVPFSFREAGRRSETEESDYDLFIEEEETCKESSAFCASEDWYKCFRAIADTKPGDILASRDGLDIVIFKKVDDFQYFSSYYNIRGKLNICWINKQFIPATKEQRNLLFQKIKEEGYEWNFSMKELKKIDVDMAEKKIKTRKMTYKELSWWLREHPEEHREYTHEDIRKSSWNVYSCYDYNTSYADEEVNEYIRIRKNGGEWEEPLIEI